MLDGLQLHVWHRPLQLLNLHVCQLQLLVLLFDPDLEELQIAAESVDFFDLVLVLVALDSVALGQGLLFFFEVLDLNGQPIDLVLDELGLGGLFLF